MHSSLDGAKIRNLFKPDLTIKKVSNSHVIIEVRNALIFTNWLSFKGSLKKVEEYSDITIDLSHTNLVDHTVMESLEELIHEPHGENGKIVISGLDSLKPVSKHPNAARKSMVMAMPDFSKK